MKELTKTRRFFRLRIFGMPKVLWNLIRCYVVLSGVLLTMTATLRGSVTEAAISAAVSLGVCCWLVFHQQLLESTVDNFSVICCLIALPYAVAASWIFMGLL